MLYSYKNGRPSPLPHRITLSNGHTRTDVSTFTTEEIIDAGYIPFDNPPEVEYPNLVDWNGFNWLVREPSENEINNRIQHIQNECQRMLFETDYKVIKAVEQGVPVDSAVVVYRQALRDLYNSVSTGDPWNITWPLLETE